LTAYTEIGGSKAWTLWDIGSTMSGITPSYVHVAKIMAYPLTNPYILQLGTIGSCASITHGVNNIEYLNIANFDQFDMIISTPLMHCNNVILDFW
ncbi:hypothetical protein BDQ12DRAFT_616891, partial [Crucibulum laeve]